MTHPILSEALAESCRTVPGTLAAVCADLHSGDIVVSYSAEDADADPADLADAAKRVFAGGREAGLDKLWRGLGDVADGGDEIVVLEPERHLVFLRPPARPGYALVFLTARASDIGLTIARARAAKISFNEALRRL
jgi:hypothetical protein